VVLLAILVRWGRAVEAVTMATLPEAGDVKIAFVGCALVSMVVLRRRLLRMGKERPYLTLATSSVFVACSMLAQTHAEWAHIVFYTALGFALSKGRLPGSYGSVLVCGLIVGVGDELAQSLQPSRVADPWDVVLDLFGMALGILLAAFWPHEKPMESAQVVNEECRFRGCIIR
jgi:hypothetical protein